MSNESTKKSNFPPQVYHKVLDLFATKGYSGTSMSTIATALGMSKGNLYYYCSSKEDLLYRIHLEFLKRNFIPMIEEAEGMPDPKDRITFFLRKLVFLNTANKASRVLIPEIHNLNKSHHNEIMLIFQRAYELLTDSIQELQRSGRARKFRKSFATFLGVGMANWIAYWFDYSRQSNAEELAETAVQLFENGLFYSDDK